MVRRLVLIPVLALALLAGAGTAAQASCAAPQPPGDQIKAAAVVFIGTVVYTTDADRVARVRVESIWKGPNLAAYVDVHGSPVSGPFAASSVDRTYQPGVRYLFVLYSADQPLQDNSCTGTQPYTPDLAALAPLNARPGPEATPLDAIQNFAGQHGWVVALIAIALVTAVAATILNRRRRRIF
jgi:hypothetical protein